MDNDRVLDRMFERGRPRSLRTNSPPPHAQASLVQARIIQQSRRGVDGEDQEYFEM